MPQLNPDLHGMVPDKANAALLMLDMINDLEFDGAEPLAEQMLPVAQRLAALKKRAKAAGIPTIYVNDNYGRWQSDLNKLVTHCLQEDVRGQPIAKMLAPEEDDYFVLKPKHSGFFSTTLDVLLNYLEARTLIITGVAGNICVLFTANDAFMRDFRLHVPSDCCASNDPYENRHALAQMEAVLKADTTPSDKLDLEALLRQGEPQCPKEPSK